MKTDRKLRLGILLAMGIWIVIGMIPISYASEVSKQMAELINQLENRYRQADFSVQFTQASTLKAMEITETAAGRLLAKDPGKMRWEYETPEPQLIVTDGKNLWIHRPLDNQVMIGRAPALFGSGKGAGFLADISSLKSNFSISLAADKDGPKPVLKLVPNTETPELASAYLTVEPSTGEVVRIVSYNHYEDETRIDLSNYDFKTPLADRLFQFDIPEDADILRLDQ